MKTIAIIKGAHCNSCKLLIEDVCRDIEGVRSCEVDLQTGVTVIEHTELFDSNLFKQEVEALGEYNVEFNS